MHADEGMPGYEVPAEFSGAWDSVGTDSPARVAWVELVLAEERAIGRAFAEALLPRVPGGLGELGDLPPVDDETLGFLARDVSVVAAGDPGLALARVGLTPLDVLGAASSISNLVSRTGGRGRPIAIGTGPDIAGDIPRREIDGEVALYCDLPPRLATPLASWVIRASATVTRLFRRYASARCGEVVVLTHDGHEDDDLSKGWAA